MPTQVIDTISAYGRTYAINNPAGLIGKPIAQGRPYEQHLLELIHGEAHKGTAVDIGAHVGNHTLWFAAICGLQVHAFDPIHTDALRANVTLNDLEDRVTVHGCALGASEDVADIVGKDRLSPGAGEIPVRTLDSFGIEDVSVVKIDVEDMEPDVLRGGQRTICEQRPVIYAEARDSECHDRIADVIEPWGYVYTLTAKTATPVERWEWRG